MQQLGPRSKKQKYKPENENLRTKKINCRRPNAEIRQKGNLLRKLHYKNGKLEFSEDYHEKGNLKTRDYYENWEPAGLWESFDEDGKLIDYAEFH